MAAVGGGVQQIAGAFRAGRRRAAQQGFAGYGFSQSPLRQFLGIAAQLLQSLQQGGIVKQFRRSQGTMGAALPVQQPQGPQGYFQFHDIFNFHQEVVKERVGNRREADAGRKAVERHR